METFPMSLIFLACTISYATCVVLAVIAVKIPWQVKIILYSSIGYLGGKTAQMLAREHLYELPRIIRWYFSDIFYVPFMIAMIVIVLILKGKPLNYRQIMMFAVYCGIGAMAYESIQILTHIKGGDANDIIVEAASLIACLLLLHNTKKKPHDP